MMTIGQIAKAAGVSKSTVSRVLNNSGYVHEDTRKKIEQIIKENHYSPSASAQNLSRRETNTIGIIIPELDNAFYTEVLAGVSDAASEHGYTVIVSNTGNDWRKEEAALNMMEHQRVRGVIFASAMGYKSEDTLNAVRRQLKNLHVPVVLVDRELDHVPWDGVYYENYRSGYLCAERLIKRGCKTIGIITGDLQQKHAKDRYLGYREALEEYGIAFRPEYVYEGDFTIDTAFDITEGLFAKDDWPEGMVLTNNRTTIGYLKSIRAHGKELEGMTKVVCIDHITILDLFGYRYDCVTRDMAAMGKAAIEMLVERFEMPDKDRKLYMIPCIIRFDAEKGI